MPMITKIVTATLVTGDTVTPLTETYVDMEKAKFEMRELMAKQYGTETKVCVDKDNGHTGRWVISPHLNSGHEEQGLHILLTEVDLPK